MKLEKYKKMFSEKIKGENNPNHKSKTTQLERNQRSPFSIEFYKLRYPNETDEQLKLRLSEFAKDAVVDRIGPMHIEYYLNQGYDEETSQKMLSERQSTFSKEICIKKYGEKEGLKRWEERQNKWQKSLLENGNMKCGYSQISQNLFDDIMEYYPSNEIDNVMYAIKNSEYTIEHENGLYSYDFTDLNRRKIIEYNGDIFHANPKIYESNDCPNPYRENLKSKDIWKYDEEKLKTVEMRGFDVLIIWDSEYRENPDKILNKCKEFLKL